ncbi:MAG: hypothetical protein LDL41_02945 [Coleofasciculus sp. S288]|nr:hypothetical protein [Coleofasciculus sp. S288]
MSNAWQTIGKINLQELAEARLQLHYAIQFIAATGNALAEPKPDYSHSSLGWNPKLNAFVGEVIQANTPFQVALDPVSLTSLILNQKGETIASFPLHQKTLGEGMKWHKEEISKLGAEAEKITFLSYPPDDFPDHALAHGASFDATQEAGLKALTDYYANTHLLLQEIVATTEGTSPIHTWPHHFDMATLITLPSTKNGEAMTIGVGMSPGDQSYNEPYWYITPYPYPDTATLPELDGDGFWHTQHWVGAVLKTSQLSENETAEAQQEKARAFVNSAIKALRSLLI